MPDKILTESFIFTKINHSNWFVSDRFIKPPSDTKINIYSILGSSAAAMIRELKYVIESFKIKNINLVDTSWCITNHNYIENSLDNIEEIIQILFLIIKRSEDRFKSDTK